MRLITTIPITIGTMITHADISLLVLIVGGAITGIPMIVTFTNT